MKLFDARILISAVVLLAGAAPGTILAQNDSRSYRVARRVIMAEPAASLQDPLHGSPRHELKTYLEEHGLNNLLIGLLENDFLDQSDDRQRQILARDLTRLYAKLLNSNHGDFDLISDRLDELQQEFRDVLSFQTRISVALGRFRRGKSLFESWIWNRSDPELRTNVERRFLIVIDRANTLREQAMAEVERLRNQNPPDSTQLGNYQNIVSQCSYLLAWSSYYRGLAVSDPAQRRALLASSHQQFKQLLQIPADRDVTTLKPQWFALNIEWSCRSLLGLAMASQALGFQQQAAYCFELLSGSQVPDSIRANRPVWEFHACFFPGMIDQAIDVASSQLEHPEHQSTGKPFWSTVAMAGIAISQETSPVAPAQSNQLIVLGLSGLAQENAFSTVDQLLDLRAVKIEGNDFFSNWLSGYSSLRRFGKSRNAAELELALTRLATSVKQSQDGTKPVHRARCRYHFGFALYYKGDFQKAAEELRQVVAVLQDLDPDTAEQAMWMQCQAYEKLAKRDEVWKRPLSFLLDEFQRRYPTSPHAPKAAFMQTLSDVSQQSAEQAIETLKSIDVDSINYPRSLYEICRLWHVRWSRSKPDSVEQNQMADQVLSAAAEYYYKSQSPQNRNAALRLAKVCLLAADVNRRSNQMEMARRWADRCQPLEEFIESDPPTNSELHYLKMVVAEHLEDDDAVWFFANWLVNQSPKAKHRRAALISQTRLLDKQIQASVAPSGELIRQSISTYQMLIEESESDGESIVTSHNSRAALLRLADLQFASGNFPQAAKSYQRLQQVMPHEQRYLLGLARSQMRQDHFAEAIEHWRTIANGSQPGGNIWLEAKYNLIKCLQNSDVNSAKRVVQQTHVLVPEMPEPWAQMFRELESRLLAK